MNNCSGTWVALAAKPKVLVVSEALYTELEPVRRHLPECLIVNTRHGLGDKNHAALGASQCDRICVSSPSIADLLAEQEVRAVTLYRSAADGALRALRQTAPFDVPQGFPGGAYRPTFNTERACRNR